MVDTVVLGVDALDARWVKYWLSRGRMKNVRSMVVDGTLSFKDFDTVEKKSHKQPTTPIAWPAIYNGVHPDVSDAGAPPNEIRDFEFDTEMGSTLFDDISSAGLKLGSFRMPMTWPAREVNGWMVSGYPAGGREVKELTESEVTGKTPDEFPDWFHEIEEARFTTNDPEHRKSLKNYILKEERAFEMFVNVLDGDEDVAFYGTQVVDHIGHYFFEQKLREFGDDRRKDHDALAEADPEERDFATSKMAGAVYGATDELIGKTVERLDPETVWIIADHGFARDQLTEKTHSHHPCLMQWSKDGTPSTEGVDDITDFRVAVTDRLGVRRVDELYAEKRDVQLSEEDEQRMEEHLDDLGYL